MSNPDASTDDMFGHGPEVADLEAPTMDLKVRIARAMSMAMKKSPADRFEIAARMSRVLAPREITKNMLDAYAAASKDSHIPNLSFCIAFDAATEQNELLRLYASLRGCGILVGTETLRAEVMRLDQQIESLQKKKRQIKNTLGRSSK